MQDGAKPFLVYAQEPSKYRILVIPSCTRLLPSARLQGVTRRARPYPVSRLWPLRGFGASEDLSGPCHAHSFWGTSPQCHRLTAAMIPMITHLTPIASQASTTRAHSGHDGRPQGRVSHINSSWLFVCEKVCTSAAEGLFENLKAP